VCVLECVSGLGVRGALLAVRADAGVRRQPLRGVAGPLGPLGVALALAGVLGRDALAVPAGQPLDLVPLAVDDDADRVPAPLAHPAHDLHAVRVAVLDGLRADPADPGVPQDLPGLLVEAADLAADLRRRRGLRLRRDRLAADGSDPDLHAEAPPLLRRHRLQHLNHLVVRHYKPPVWVLVQFPTETLVESVGPLGREVVEDDLRDLYEVIHRPAAVQNEVLLILQVSLRDTKVLQGLEDLPEIFGPNFADRHSLTLS
jgi:hypothetical protein